MLTRPVCLLGLLAAVWAAPFPLGAHRLPIQVFTTAQGLPRNLASCLVPDQGGLLWICTTEGLVRFDGSEFRTFGRDQGLPSLIVLDFIVSRKGGYWLLTDRGVCRLQPGSKIGDPCRLLTIARKDGDFQSEALVESKDGRIWVATQLAVYRSSADGKSLEWMSAPHPLRAITAVGEAPDGRVLLSTEHGVYLGDGQSYREISGPPLSGCSFGQIHTVSPREILVVGSCNVYRITGWGSDENLRLDPIVRGGRIQASQIIVRRDRSLWFTAPPGLRHWEWQPDGTLAEKESFGTSEGLPYSWIMRLAEDNQGNLWGATQGLGIFRILASGFRVFSSADGLGSARVSSIFESRAGDLCVTTSAEGGSAPQSHLRVRNGDRFDRVDFLRDSRFHNWGWGWNQVALQDVDGEWWIQTEQGLYRFRKKDRAQDLKGIPPAFVYDRSTALAEDDIFRIFEDAFANLWISAISPRNELIRWERATGQFHHFTPAEGWPADTSASVFRQARNGTMWLGTDDGVLRYRNGRFEPIVPPSAGGPSAIRDLYIDHAGRVWVATLRTGLYRCDNPDDESPAFRHYGAHDGLSSDSTRSITEDQAGLIYVGTVRAIDRIDPREPIGGANILHFTAADGVPDADQNVAYRDRQGHLWFGTLMGLAEYDPTQSAVRSNPDIYIRRVRVRGEDVPLPWDGTRHFHLDLPSDKNQVEIEYAGIDLRSVASLRYQYRLSGVDSDWSPPSTRFSINYANMPPGQRIFEVRAVSADGTVGTAIAALTMALDAPVWRRTWFLMLAALLICAIVYQLYSYRVSHLLAMERLRTRIATDLHDDIGASLTQISVLSEVGGRDPSRNVLSEVAVISRDMVDEMSDIVWAVSPRHDRFDSIVHRMRRFAEDAMADGEVVFDTSELPADLPLPLELRRPLYLIFKEAVNNVARHSEATRMVIRIAARESHIELLVEDNGQGFDPPQFPHGEGLTSIRRRVKELSGSVKWDTAPGHGTQFQARLPLPAHRPMLAVFVRTFRLRSWRKR